MSSCTFCAIAAGDGEASVVHDDSEVLAFTDLHPVTPGHLLVIPRVHVPYLSWTDEFLAGKVFAVAHQLAAALPRSGVRCDGVNLWVAEGQAAGQQVYHLHIHVIPRFDGDGFGVHARPSAPPRAELDRVAAGVRRALEPEEPPEDD